ncbi:hypothetical protein [Suttonella ornithocola]|uniref:hypothetical protein n=1 Tax=Suttonella ornithocola TaxID=279832 RepID=UPI0011C02AB5|nr:hypothetical protein [Suttonella ornithocola]
MRKAKTPRPAKQVNSTAAVTGVELGGSADDGYLNAKEVGGQDSVSVPVTIGLNGRCQRRRHRDH